MLIRVFKSNQKVVNVLVMLLAIVLWLPSFFIGVDIDSLNLISTQIKWLDISIALFLIISQSIYLNFIVNEYKLIQQSSYLTSLFLVVLNSSCIWMLDLNQVVIANTFLLIAFHQILKLYDVKNSLALLFNSGFLVALASLIYFPSILYFGLVWIGLIYMTTPKIRGFIVSLIGFSVPLIYFFCYKFMLGSLSQIQISDYLLAIFNVEWSSISFLMKASWIVIAVIMLLSFMNLTTALNKGMVKTRKMFFVIVIMSLLSICTLFLNKGDYIATFIMLSIPLSIIVANFFQSINKKWLAELLFTCLFVGIVLSYFS
ncbi:MAG: hypothetical protein COB15_13515 [Flavobacteriales bacterium]|nr:MAG: hypothetical protein COB15_13515 [Flavobacteriales bacterium]